MKLSEALKASKTREAVAVVYLKDSTVCFSATDAGVTIMSGAGYTKKTWVDLLPDEHELAMGASWEPSNPKPPLQQLADVLTDWSDDS